MEQVDVRPQSSKEQFVAVITAYRKVFENYLDDQPEHSRKKFVFVPTLDKARGRTYCAMILMHGHENVSQDAIDYVSIHTVSAQ
jgi:hypothetical protein